MKEMAARVLNDLVFKLTASIRLKKKHMQILANLKSDLSKKWKQVSEEWMVNELRLAHDENS